MRLRLTTVAVFAVAASALSGAGAEAVPEDEPAGARPPGSVLAVASERKAAVCGRFRAGGATWGAKTTRVSCAVARKIVRKLARQTAPLPGGRYPGRYAGMTCGGVVPGSKPRIITCRGGGRQIVAGREA